MIEFTSAQARELKALAHDLSPVVMIGNKGLTDAVVAETDKALDIHQLIKIKAHGADKSDLKEMGLEIAQKLDCGFVGAIGRTMIFFRPKPEE